MDGMEQEMDEGLDSEDWQGVVKTKTERKKKKLKGDDAITTVSSEDRP